MRALVVTQPGLVDRFEALNASGVAAHSTPAGTERPLLVVVKDGIPDTVLEYRDLAGAHGSESLEAIANRLPSLEPIRIRLGEESALTAYRDQRAVVIPSDPARGHPLLVAPSPGRVDSPGGLAEFLTSTPLLAFASDSRLMGPGGPLPGPQRVVFVCPADGQRQQGWSNERLYCLKHECLMEFE